MRVAVIGAGIVGVAAAVWLQREGAEVLLVDREGPAAGASLGNGGVLAACASVPVTGPGLARKAPGMLLDRESPLFLRWSYLPRLAPWLRRYLRHCPAGETRRIAAALHALVGDSLADHRALAAGTGAERFVMPCDYLYLYRDRSGFEADGFGWEVRRGLGRRWRELDAAAIAALGSGYSPALRFGLRMDGHGRISDPGAYVRALADYVVARGGRLVRAEAEDVVREGGRVVGLRAGGETLDCAAVVIAAGAWSRRLARRIGFELPMESERGYHLDLWEPSLMPRLPAMIAEGKFVATPMEGRLRLAGIVEFGGLDAPASDGPAAFLRRKAREAFPDLAWREAREWMGHRPVLPDSLPAIGPVPGLAGAYLAAGHHHVGLTAGALTGRLVAQLVTGRRPNIDLAPYAPARFQ